MKVNIDGELRHLFAVWYENDVVKLIDQRKLPERIEVFEARNSDEIAFAIKDMVVRGAPAIGVTAAYGLAMAKKNGENMDEAVFVIERVNCNKVAVSKIAGNFPHVKGLNQAASSYSSVKIYSL